VIIDTHIHLLDKFESIEGTSVEALMRDLKDHNIEHAWAFTLMGFYNDCKTENDKLKALCDKSNGFFTPFMTVNPRDEIHAIEEMERAYYELGMKGLKMHPWCQSFSMTNKWFFEICRKCADLEIPLVIHDGTPPFCEPYQACYIAEKHPGLKLILGHSGLNDLWKEALYGAMRLPNIYLCTCSTPYFGLKTIIKNVGSERILFGSDAGFGDPLIIDNNLDKIFLMDLKDEDLNNILYKNARIMLKKDFL
jgi:predicted TIM-barrel fold metal-dependent hydrolase